MTLSRAPRRHVRHFAATTLVLGLATIASPGASATSVTAPAAPALTPAGQTSPGAGADLSGPPTSRRTTLTLVTGDVVTVTPRSTGEPAVTMEPRRASD